MNIKNAIDKAAEISFKIKELEKELKPLKTEVQAYVKKTYADQIEMIKTHGHTFDPVTIQGVKFESTIVIAEKRDDADPEKVLDYLTKKKLGDRFFDIVKVSATDLTKLIGDEQSKTLRPIIDVTIRQSFKSKK